MAQLLGMLMAATALTVLTASRISQLRTIGRRRSVLARLVVTEGAVTGMAGSLTGAAALMPALTVRRLPAQLLAEE